MRINICACKALLFRDADVAGRLLQGVRITPVASGVSRRRRGATRTGIRRPFLGWIRVGEYDQFARCKEITADKRPVIPAHYGHEKYRYCQQSILLRRRTALQGQTTLTAYFPSEQLPLFVFVLQRSFAKANSSNCLLSKQAVTAACLCRAVSVTDCFHFLFGFHLPLLIDRRIITSLCWDWCSGERQIISVMSSSTVW